MLENYSRLVEKQKSFFKTGQTKELSFRLEALKKLQTSIRENEKKIIQALKDDLNKSEFEAYSTEVGFVLSELRYIMKHLPSWVKPKKVKTPMTHIGSSSIIYSEPYGTALIISPWNYPFQLAIAPLIGAICAGNCSVIKPSELSPKTSKVVAEMIHELFPEEYIAVKEGAVETSQALLKEPFDYIFFTGSVYVGKIVMEAAGKNLTPVTLELGGKSPCIVHEDANIPVAAKRIAWGKFTNAGQTCIAPDYVYVYQGIKDVFLNELKKVIHDLYGQEPLENPNYTRIVSEKHFKRLQSFLNNGTCFTGGKSDEKQLMIEPTILTNVTWKDPIMGEEIFGPLMPVMEYEDINEVIDTIQDHPKPLALYLFTKNKTIEKEILNHVSFGGGCINDTIYHISTPHLPFGGVGSSGLGAYHGKSSFDTFSHKKSVLKQTTLFDIPLRYPNVKNGLKKIKLFLK